MSSRYSSRVDRDSRVESRDSRLDRELVGAPPAAPGRLFWLFILGMSAILLLIWICELKLIDDESMMTRLGPPKIIIHKSPVLVGSPRPSTTEIIIVVVVVPSISPRGLTTILP